MTDDFVNDLREEIEKDKKTPVSIPLPSNSVPGQVVVHKFMLTIDVYSSGKIYPKMFPIGQARKSMSNKGKGKKKKAMKEVQVNETEVY